MHEFISTIFYTFMRAIPLALVALVIGVIILVMVTLKYRREGRKFPKSQAVALILLLCYLGGLIAITFMNRFDGVRMGVQLYPLLAFWEAWNSFTLQVWLNPLLNIAMFIPFGVLLPLAVKTFRRWYWMFVAGTGTSLVIEIVQYILGRGQADVDDLICNTLGAMLGYCLYGLVISLVRRRWKLAIAHALLPLLSGATLAGVFLVYQLQPYGNLADAPIYATNTKGVEWIQECSLSDEPGPSGVYWTEPFTKESSDAFAVEFLGQQGAEIRFGTPDVSYYDNTAFYSDHQTYSLWVNYNDRSYEYTDFRVDSSLRYSETGGTITEGELRDALEQLGIELPDTLEFIVTDETRGKYTFRAGGTVEDDQLIYGEITCWEAEGGILYKVENALSVSTRYGDAAVISPQEAYERLCTGNFSWRDAAMFRYYAPKQVRVIDCNLEYLADSKGFRQPIYTFTLSDEYDMELRSGNGWTTFVLGLKG